MNGGSSMFFLRHVVNAFWIFSVTITSCGMARIACPLGLSLSRWACAALETPTRCIKDHLGTAKSQEILVKEVSSWMRRLISRAHKV
jgi:hypothetical protein